MEEITFEIPQELLQRLIRIAKELDMSIDETIEEALSNYAYAVTNTDSTQIKESTCLNS